MKPNSNIRHRLSRRLGAILSERDLTLAVAESCTGGMLGSVITETTGSSRYFLGGVIVYDNRSKQKLLGVPSETLRRFGAVSEETVAAMARGARKLLGADCAISVSGIAGPGGGTEEKPVGLVYIGIALEKELETFSYRFSGTRRTIREKATEEALKRVIRMLVR